MGAAVAWESRWVQKADMPCSMVVHSRLSDSMCASLHPGAHLALVQRPLHQLAQAPLEHILGQVQAQPVHSTTSTLAWLLLLDNHAEALVGGVQLAPELLADGNSLQGAHTYYEEASACSCSCMCA